MLILCAVDFWTVNSVLGVTIVVKTKRQGSQADLEKLATRYQLV